jgi:hypothetical protein
MFYSNIGDPYRYSNYTNYTTPILPNVQQPSEPAVDNINDLYVYIKSEFDKIDYRLSKLESNQQQEINEINKAKEDIKSTVRRWS